MPRKPIILSVAFERPYSVFTHTGVETREHLRAFGVITDVCHMISGYLGATPALATTDTPADDLVRLARLADGIVLSGGDSNVHPRQYGHDTAHDRQVFDTARDAAELALVRAAQQHKIPLLGICRGMQIINTFYGGTLLQQLPNKGIDHNCSYTTMSKLTDDKHTHGLSFSSDAFLARWLGDSIPAQEVRVGSAHGQAIDTLGDNLRVEARAPDDVIEAIRLDDPRHFVYAVQWHPDYNQTLPASKAVLDAFSQQVKNRAHKNNWRRLLTGQ